VKKKIKRGMIDLVVVFFQIIAYFTLFFYLRYFFKIDKKIAEDIKEIKKGSLFIANHQSMLDPFLIFTNLPFLTLLKIVPIYFPTSPDIYKKIKLSWLLGTYSVGETRRERMLGLLRTRNYLENGKTVMIFPEGKICRCSSILELKEGITFLTDFAKNTIFVKLDGFQYKFWYEFRGNRKLVYEKVGDNSNELGNIELIKKYLKNI